MFDAIKPKEQEAGPLRQPPEGLAVATFAGGCFWCMQAPFEGLPGVQSIAVGYTGGQSANPTYKEVCFKDTGHYEAVRVTYDPSQVQWRRGFGQGLMETAKRRCLALTPGLSLGTPIFFLRRTALKDSPPGPPTATPPTTNRQPPPTTNRQPPPTANRQLPPTANHCPILFLWFCVLPRS